MPEAKTIPDADATRTKGSVEIQLLEGADVLGRAPDATPEDGEWEPLKEELREDLEDADVLEDPLHTDLEDASTQEESR